MNSANLKSPTRLPFYAKAALVCVGLYTFVSILSITDGIIVPLIYATLAAILISPVVNLLVRKGMNRILAITIALVAMLAIGVSIAVIVSHQIIRFTEALPQLGEKLQQLLNETANWISANFNINADSIHAWLGDRKAEAVNNAGTNVGKKLITSGSALVVIILIPVYIFLILYYKPLLLRFVHQLFTVDSQNDVDEVIQKTKKIIQTYLVGLIFEAIIVAILYTIALLAIGIEYAILLALIGAILNLIPYIGSIIAATLPIILALATKPFSYAFLVLGSYVLIQIIDNNFIVPRIVASRVRINALVSIIVVIAYGTLWGIPGMFLAIPLTAIIKVIFDHIQSMRPISYVLGDSVPALPPVNAKPAQAKPKKKRRKFYANRNNKPIDKK